MEACTDRYSSQCKNNYSIEIGSSSEEGSYLRLTDACITQLKAPGDSRASNESKEEEGGDSTSRSKGYTDRKEMCREEQFSIQEQLLSRNAEGFQAGLVSDAHRLLYHSTLGSRVIKKGREDSTSRSKGYTDRKEMSTPMPMPLRVVHLEIFIDRT